MVWVAWKPMQAPLQASAQYSARKVLERMMPKPTCNSTHVHSKCCSIATAQVVQSRAGHTPLQGSHTFALHGL